MTDPAPAATPAPVPADAASDSATPPKKPARWFRLGWKTLLVLFLILVVVAIALPIWANRTAKTMIIQQLLARGLVPDDPDKIQVSVLGARLHADNLHLLDSTDHSEAASATTITVQLALMDSISAWDVIVDDITVDGMAGNFRRRADGRPPTVLAPPPAPGEPMVDWSKVDWNSWYQWTMQKAKDQYDQAHSATAAASATAPAVKPPPPYVDDPHWPGARTYEPTPSPDRHTPRLLIRKLSISGGKLDLPDASPLDIVSFSATGANVAARQNAGETMTLAVKLTTSGAGPITLDLKRQPEQNGTGTLAVAAPQLPLTLLDDPAIAGADLPKWGASGTAAVVADNAWTGWALQGTVTNTITGLALAPQPGAPSDAAQVAAAVAALKGRPIVWPVTLGGSLYAPTITDSGYKKAIAGNALGAAEGLAADQAAKLIQQRLGGNPTATAGLTTVTGALGIGGGTPPPAATGATGATSATTAAPAPAIPGAGALNHLFGH